MLGYKMRPIMRQDLEELLLWRNSERVHSMMLTEHFVQWDEHLAWFERISQEKVLKNFIFLHGEKKIGYIGYFNFNEKNNSCSIGVYLGEVLKDTTEGFYLYVLATKYAFEILNVNEIFEETLIENKVAILISQFIGYKPLREEKNYCNKNGVYKTVKILSINKKEWDNYVLSR